ncbi:MAG TPA: MBL fold metallo-hydrolase [Anaerolineales bacterium]|nr:MBL fold metallo-hydrolase [Anaerolineae bacterium]HIQ01727.1 MBL fold metallo-hydrolase [Anaerolineales bacterium]
MEIQFFGAAQTVTGSQYLITVNGSHLLLECGLFQGRRRESYERNRNLPFDAAAVDGMVLSHAHIDHSGNIPNLVRSGFDGPIYCTFATRDLCSAMLRDSAYIQEQDIAYVNKKRAQKGEPPVSPIYTHADAIASLKQFVSVGYERTIPVAPGVTCTFLDAGHILGSAILLLEMENHGKSTRLLFTGDLGRRGLPILRDPTPAPDADVLITESTYGDRLHPPPPEAEARLRDLVVETCSHGGKVIIPSFAVGRTQEIVYSLHRLSLAGAIPDVPIFVDSPLAVNVTDVFRLHPECYDQELRDFIAQDRHPDPFGFDRLQYIRNVEDSKALNDLDGPAIIISASGMCEAGRILHHLKNTIWNPRNAILIVSWQAPHTLGRRLVEQHAEVRIFGEKYPLRARVEVINGYSSHADRAELLDWIRPILPRLRQIFVVHGDPGPATALAEGLREMGARQVAVPTLKATYELV